MNPNHQVSQSELRRHNHQPVEAVLPRGEPELSWYQTLYESLPSIYFTLDGGGDILSVNQYGAARLGYSAYELIGTSILSVFHPQDQERLQKEFMAFLHNPTQFVNGEFCQICKDGRRLWVKMIAQTLQQADKNLLLLIIYEHIAENKQLEKAQQEDLQQLNTYLEYQVQERTAALQQALKFEAMLKRITDRVRDSLDEGQILQTAVQELALVLKVERCNTALYDMEQNTATVCYEYSTSISSVQGRVFPVTEFPDAYQQLLQGQAFQFCSISQPSLLLPFNGQQYVTLACPIFDDQRLLGDLCLFRQKEGTFSELEIRLVQQVANQCAIAIRQARLWSTTQGQVAELARLNQVRNDFLSTISHELRSPMANMKMAIQMLAVMFGQDRTLAQHSRAHRYLKILQDECTREISLINDLLDLQQLETDEHVLIVETIHLQPWLLETIAPFPEQFHRQQQTLHVNIAPNLPPIVTDPSSLKRIVIELLANALKYTPPGETIAIIANAQENTVQLQVINSGVEIPTTELPRIFDKFYRIPSADPWRQGGTGLGLALVQKLIELMQGSIQVESTNNQTCFTVELPLRMPQRS